MNSRTHHLLTRARIGCDRSSSSRDLICHQLVTWIIDNVETLNRIDSATLLGFAELVRHAGDSPHACASLLRQYGFELTPPIVPPLPIEDEMDDSAGKEVPDEP